MVTPLSKNETVPVTGTELATLGVTVAPMEMVRGSFTEELAIAPTVVVEAARLTDCVSGVELLLL
jgi:hypothetical protein